MSDEQQPMSAGAHTTAVIIQIVLFVVIIIGGVFTAQHLFSGAPKAQRSAKKRQARLVQVETIQQQDFQIVLDALATVQSAKSSTLQMEVSGRVKSISEDLFPGNVVKQGQVLLSLDDRHYQNVLQQRLADLAMATKDYKLELGNNAVALREFELTGVEIKDEERELVLRLPQLASAKVAMASAQKRVDEARTDIERCQLRAPYDCIIVEKLTDVGEMISGSKAICQVIGSQVFWLEALISESEVSWLEQGNKTAVVHHALVWGEQTKSARVLRVLPQLEEQGRMLRVLLAVEQPLAAPSLFIDSVVDVRINGPQITGKCILKSAHVHEGDFVWIAENGKLQKREISVLWRNRDYVIVESGVQAGEQIITSALTAVTDGLDIEIEGRKHSDD